MCFQELDRQINMTFYRTLGHLKSLSHFFRFKPFYISKNEDFAALGR